MWCRVGGVGARPRKRAGLGYRLVRKHGRTEMLGLLISMFLGLGTTGMTHLKKLQMFCLKTYLHLCDWSL